MRSFFCPHVGQCYVAESGRLLQGMHKFEAGFVAAGTHYKFHENPAFFVGRLDAEDPHACRKNFLQVHEHLGPVQALLIDQRV